MLDAFGGAFEMRAILASVLALLLTLPAAAQDLPPRRPGLWNLNVTFTIQGQTSPPQTTRYCIDAATDREIRALDSGVFNPKCETQTLRREGNTVVMDGECKVGDQPIRAHAVSTGSFETNYRTVLRITRIGTPPFPSIPPEMTITTSANWAGACAAGQEPGDIVMPDGSRLNIRTIQAARAQPAPAQPGLRVITGPDTPPPAKEALKNFPTRKPGLWEIYSVFEGDVLPVQNDQVCVDAETDHEMQAVRSNVPSEVCRQYVKRDGDSHVLTGRCAGPDGMTVSHAVITGHFDSAYQADI